MKRVYLFRKLRFLRAFYVMILFSSGLVVVAGPIPASAQEGKYDAVYDAVHDDPALPDDALKTTTVDPVVDTALRLHPDMDTRNADDIRTSISNRDEMPPLLSFPTGSRSSVNAGMNRRGPAYDSPIEFHRVTDSNQNDDEVYYLNLNIQF